MTNVTGPWRANRRGEDGSTLLELMFAISVISLTFLGIMGLVTTLAASSLTHRELTHDGILVTQISEALERVNYIKCGSPTAYKAAIAAVPADANPIEEWPNYSYEIDSVTYLVDKGATTPSFGSSCSPTTDKGAQSIRVIVESDAGRSQFIDFTKRQNLCPANYPTIPGDHC